MREQFTHTNTKLLYHGANTELLALSKQISLLVQIKLLVKNKCPCDLINKT